MMIRYAAVISKISSGVPTRLRNGLTIGGPNSMMNSEHSKVSVMDVPTVFDRLWRSFAPKYCATMMFAPVEMPIKSTSSRLSSGPLAPTAASAPSPTYLPTIIESTVL